MSAEPKGDRLAIQRVPVEGPNARLLAALASLPPLGPEDDLLPAPIDP